MLAGVLFGLSGLSACETTGDLTVDLPDTKPTSSTFLELPVSGATVLLNPALTLKTDHFLVGRLRDQTTGTTEARGVLNLQLDALRPDSLPSKQPNATLESVVLLAPFEQVYGTATTPARLDVLPLAQKLDERVVYTASSAPSVGAQPLATNVSVPLNATRQVTQTAEGTGATVTTTVADPVFRQVLQTTGGSANPLFASIFQKLNAPSLAQADLDALLPGLVLAPSAGYEGSIIGFGRGSVGAQLRFNFTYDSVQTAPLPTVRKRRSYGLVFGPGRGGSGAGTAQDPRYYTYLANDRGGSPLAALTGQSAVVPAAALDGRSYLQEGIGLGTRIVFSDLAKLEALRNTPGVAINRAELQVPVLPFTSGVFPYPATFYALEVDGQNQVLTRTVDQVVTERIVQRDGYNQQRNDYEAAATLVNASSTAPYYSFVMTSYLQAYLTASGLGTDATTGASLPLPAALILTPTLRGTTVAASTGLGKVTPSLTLNRAVLDANNIRLRVYYSQLR